MIPLNMFIKAFILLLTLSNTVLCLPSTNELLEKRDTWPWIGSLDDSDSVCRNHVGPRPEVRLYCINFEPTTQNVGT